MSQGDNRGEALANIQEAIKLCLDDRIDGREPVPVEAGGKFVAVEAAWVDPALMRGCPVRSRAPACDVA